MRMSATRLGLSGALAAASLLVPAGAAFAHHAFSMYDNTQYTKVTGVVHGYSWSNPHTMVDFVVTAADGKTETWTAECSPINMLRTRGWTSGSLKPGDKVDFVIHPNKENAHYGLLVSATLPDGSTFKDKD